MISVRTRLIVHSLQSRATSNSTMPAFCGAAVYGL